MLKRLLFGLALLSSSVFSADVRFYWTAPQAGAQPYRVGHGRRPNVLSDVIVFSPDVQGSDQATVTVQFLCDGKPEIVAGSITESSEVTGTSDLFGPDTPVLGAALDVQGSKLFSSTIVSIEISVWRGNVMSAKMVAYPLADTAY